MSQIEPLDSYADGNTGTYDVMGQATIDLLESITPVEKGLAVPYVEIWQIDPSTGKPLYPGQDPSKPNFPLTAWTITPPLFGASAEEISELRERPPVSLESVDIKTVNPYGLILYRQLNLNFVVHRPDMLSAEPLANADNWSAIITPGSIFAMEYGWVANEGQVKNPILNGNDSDWIVGENQASTVHGRKIIRFAITNYRFTILADQQIKVNVSAIEDGDYGIRHTYIIPGVRPKPLPSNPTRIQTQNFEDMKSEYDKKSKELQDKFKERLDQVKLPNKAANFVVRFEDIFQIFFVDEVETTIQELGYQQVRFTLGCCNIRCPKPLDKHDWRKPLDGHETPDKYYIGDFCIPLQDVLDQTSKMLSQGYEMTVYNFITPFLKLFKDPGVWANEGDKEVTMPDIQLRFVPKKIDSETAEAHIFIIDTKTELMRFTESDREEYQQWVKDNSTSASNVANRDEIRRICNSKGIPYVELMKGNSWIQDAQFDVIQDELIQAIFIKRYFHKDRASEVSKTEAQVRDETMDYRKNLYSSAIKGQMTCIGNHGMDVMGTYWLDFGVPQWSGPFKLLERTDKIDAGGWTTTISIISDGTDPLGTQGRPPKNSAR